MWCRAWAVPGMLTHVQYLGFLFPSSFTLTCGLKRWTWSVEQNAWTCVAGIFCCLSSDPRTGLPLPELKCGGKGREQGKAVAGRRRINGKNRCIETGRGEGRLRGGGAQSCSFSACAPAFLAFSHIMLPGDTRTTLFYFFPQNREKATSSFSLETFANREENPLPKSSSRLL